MGQHISAGVREIFNHKTATLAQGGGGFDEADPPNPYTQTKAVVMKPDTPIAMRRMAGGVHQRVQRSHEETTFSKIIGSLAELCQRSGEKTKKKVILDGDEIWSIIQCVGLEYKDCETHDKTVCSAAGSRKFDAAVFVI